VAGRKVCHSFQLVPMLRTSGGIPPLLLYVSCRGKLDVYRSTLGPSTACLKILKFSGCRNRAV